MRHTRNRQMGKLGYKGFMKSKNYKISTMHNNDPRIDKTFKWHRDFVWELEKYIESYITIGTYGQSDWKEIWIHPRRVKTR